MPAPDWTAYDRVAADYEDAVAPIMAVPARDLALAASPPPGGRHLDLGTGTGVAAAAALEAAGGDAVVVGLDASLGMLACAARVRPRILLVAASAAALPFPTASFDAVTASFVLLHLPRPEKALAEAARVLRPGGRVAVSTWLRDDDPAVRLWRDLVAEALGAERAAEGKRQATPSEERLAEEGQLGRLLDQTGFLEVRVERRRYRTERPLESYLLSRELLALGRFARASLDAAAWEDLRRQARSALGERFGATVSSSREALLAAGTKPAG